MTVTKHQTSVLCTYEVFSFLWLSVHPQHHKARNSTPNFCLMMGCGTVRIRDLPSITQWVGGRTRIASQEPWPPAPCPAHKATLPPSLEKLQIWHSFGNKKNYHNGLVFHMITIQRDHKIWQKHTFLRGLLNKQTKRSLICFFFCSTWKNSGFSYYRCLLPLAHLACNNYTL